MNRLFVLVFVLIIFALVLIQCNPSAPKYPVASGYKFIRIDCVARKTFPTLPPWSFVNPFEVSVNPQEQIKWIEINGKGFRLERFADASSAAQANPCNETTNGNLSGTICTAKVGAAGYFKYNVFCSDDGLAIDPMIKIPREVR